MKQVQLYIYWWPFMVTGVCIRTDLLHLVPPCITCTSAWPSEQVWYSQVLFDANCLLLNSPTKLYDWQKHCSLQGCLHFLHNPILLPLLEQLFANCCICTQHVQNNKVSLLTNWYDVLACLSTCVVDPMGNICTPNWPSCGCVGVCSEAKNLGMRLPCDPTVPAVHDCTQQMQDAFVVLLHCGQLLLMCTRVWILPCHSKQHFGHFQCAL